RLLVNNVGNRKHWVGLRVVTDVSSSQGGPRVRDMLGARVAVTAANGRSIWRRVHTDGSYASASDPRVLVGLGDASGPVKVRVIWPDGKSEIFDGIPVDKYSVLEEGHGHA